MSKPDPPEPPNPYATAAATTGTNVGTAIANAYLNHTNQVTPQGSLTYNTTGNYEWTDPTTLQKYNIPTFTATQTPSAQQQAIQGQQEATSYNLAGMANAQSGRIANFLSNPFSPGLDAQKYLQQNPDVAAHARNNGLDPIAFAQQHYQQYGMGEGRSGGAPTGGDANTLTSIGKPLTSFADGGPIQTGLGDYGQQQTTFGDAGDITRTYGPEDNFSADRQRVEDSLMSRMNPQLQRERSGIEQRLADQGIRYGSQAYASAMDDYNRQANDARFGAIGQAGQEQARMNQMQAQLAAFQNAAQGQAYGQAQGRGEFANQAQQQNFNQALGAGNFANAAAGQGFQQNAAQASFANSGLAQQMAQAQSGFNAQQAQRNAWLNEQYSNRNQPINEITSLMSGGQVTNPNFVNTPSTQIPTTDMAGLINNNFNQQMGIYGQQNQNYQSLMGGLLGLGAGALKASDRDVKKDVKRMATVFAATPDGEQRELPIYEYSYKGERDDGQRHVGPMAQDVERVDPKAVRTIKGTKHIDTKRTMGSILRAA